METLVWINPHKLIGIARDFYSHDGYLDMPDSEFCANMAASLSSVFGINLQDPRILHAMFASLADLFLLCQAIPNGLKDYYTDVSDDDREAMEYALICAWADLILALGSYLPDSIPDVEEYAQIVDLPATDPDALAWSVFSLAPKMIGVFDGWVAVHLQDQNPAKIAEFDQILAKQSEESQANVLEIFTFNICVAHILALTRGFFESDSPANKAFAFCGMIILGNASKLIPSKYLKTIPC